MRTFEFDDGKSRKFWTITLAGTGFTVTFGKIGTAGQTQTKSFSDSTKANKEHDKLIAEKLKKGYVETTSGTSTSGATTSGKTPTITAPGPEGFASPLRQSLETAIVENPDDLAAHMAYADHLYELGDPRGEFIQIQLALEHTNLGPGATKPLQKREAELLAKHGSAWLGSLAQFINRKAPFEAAEDEDDSENDTPSRISRPGWRRGWIDTLRIDLLSARLARAIIAQQDDLRLLRELKIIARNYEHPGFDELLTGNFFGNVRFFQVGDENDQCYMAGESAAAFVARMPLVEEVHTYARRVDTTTLFGLKMPRLRKLTVYHIHSYPLEILAANDSLTNVTHLAFWPHGLEPDDEGAYITPQGAQAIFRSPHLKSLQHLQLRLSDTGDEGVRVLVASGLLKRLKTLDLYGGCITDAGAQALAECPDLRNLEELNLGSNMLTSAGQTALRATGVKVAVKNQIDPESDEHEYLFEGDAE